MAIFGMSIVVEVLGDVFCLVRFLKSCSAERGYIVSKIALRLEDAQPVSSVIIAPEAVFTASVVGEIVPVATETLQISRTSTNGNSRLHEIMLRSPGGSAVDFAYKFRNTIRGGVTLESWLRACQSPIRAKIFEIKFSQTQVLCSLLGINIR